MMIPTRWGFERTSAFPILTVFGESNIREVELDMINIALKILEKAEAFKGKPYDEFIPVNSNFTLVISFSIIFPSEKEFNDFMRETQKGNLF